MMRASRAILSRVSRVGFEVCKTIEIITKENLLKISFIFWSKNPYP